MGAVDAHQEWLDASGERAARHFARARLEVHALAAARLRMLLGDSGSVAALDELARGIAAGETDAYAAADALLARL
jgi:LAO/AO transport system kinase